MMLFFIVFAVDMGLELNTLDAKQLFTMINYVIKLYPEPDD